MARSFDAWFAYIESHPFAGRLLFRDTSADPEIAAVHAEVAAPSRPRSCLSSPPSQAPRI